MDYASILLFYAYAKLFIGGLIVICGLVMFIRVFIGSYGHTRLTIEDATTYAYIYGTNLAVMLAGFFIANW